MKHKSTVKMCAFCLLFTIGIFPSMASASPPHSEDFLANQETATNTVKFQGKTLYLLDTYVNGDAAKAKYVALYASDLRAAQTKYSLPELTVDTASMYKQIIITEVLDGRPDLQPLVQFLDVYENPKENSQIIEQLDAFNLKISEGELSKDDGIALAKMWIPTKPKNGNDRPVYALRNSGIDLSKARAYAEKWATGINGKYGEEKKWYGAPVDCTNFASQILHAGGVPMDTYNNQNKGWWWKSKGDRSTSWVNANVFKNYMGSGYSTKHWDSFVSNVRSGDFIAVDFTSDGTVDHVGFVHTKSGRKLRIAQHTNNYLKWNGGWPDSNGRGTYYRVRR